MSDTPRIDPETTGHADAAGEDSFRWSQLRHFLHAPLRRPFLVLLPWAGVFVLSAAALFVLPKKYMSSALVLVESEKMPESFIPKVATRDPSQRLEAVRPEILSRTRLEKVLEETHPYPDITSKTRAVDKMRDSIFIYVSGNDGFTIQFYHRDPLKAQEVTDRLARLFIDETVKARAQQVEGAVDFLVTQVKDARTELESKDAALRRFKEEHMGKLPEQLDTNLATLQMLQREMQTVEESLLFAREKQDALARGASRPAGARRARVLSPSETELETLRGQMVSLRTRYKEQHPDVETLRARISRLEARLAEARSADDGPDAASESAEDTTAQVSREQLQRTQAEIRSLEDRKSGLETRIASIRGSVEETPRTEQELATLTRDYKKLDENYTALLSKQLEAQMSGRLEQRWKGERFRMLDPASLPEKPVFPKPPLFLGLGAVLGLFVGLGASLVAEYLDPTVKDSEVLQAVQGYPVLASIPHLPDLAVVSRPRLQSVGEDTPSPRRDAGEKAWGEALPGEVAFRDEGIVTLRKVIAVIESLEDHNSVVGEELRFFAANLLETCRRLKVGCLALTSALPGEGKSTLSVGLASALSREPGRRVLLIEADLRRPSFTKTLGLPPAHGLSEWLNGTLDYVPVRAVEPGGFFVVTAGQTGLKRPELLGSPRMDAVLRAGRRLFDLVLLDAVPVLPVADTVLMQDLVDGFQLVVRSRRTPREAIHDTLAKLRSDKVIGVVFNGHREYRASYKDYGYRSYGMAYASPASAGLRARLSAVLKGWRAS
jgi:polysaccharide chain length determinant protein (PEP-CTERM system associated)